MPVGEDTEPAQQFNSHRETKGDEICDGDDVVDPNDAAEDESDDQSYSKAGRRPEEGGHDELVSGLADAVDQEDAGHDGDEAQQEIDDVNGKDLTLQHLKLSLSDIVALSGELSEFFLDIFLCSLAKLIGQEADVEQGKYQV